MMRGTIRAVLVLLGLWCAAAARNAPAQQAPTQQAPTWQESIDAFRIQLREDVIADDVGGITAAVVVGDRMVWAEGFGWADRDQKIPAGVETIYRIGSISKPITTIALVQLAQAGRLSLDDPLSNWVPEADGFLNRPDEAMPITFRHLATHTSGLVREPALPLHSIGPLDEWESKVLMAIPTTRYQRPPGMEASYSNIGFATLGLAVGRAAEKPFMELVEEQIFTPLQMNQSSFRVATEDLPRLAVGYENRPREGDQPGWRIDSAGPARDHLGRGYRVPNGGVYSSAADLTRLIAAMSGVFGDLLLEESWREEMMRLQTPGSQTSGFGLGFQVRKYEDGSRGISHGGSVAGYTAFVAFDPDAKIGVILLRNYNQGKTSLGSAAQTLLRTLVARYPSANRRIADGN